jgi:transcriptional regulator with XRE-family HTH domain
MRLACRLLELRQARGLSIREVEERSGINRAYLSPIENGRLPDSGCSRHASRYGYPHI